MSTMDNAQQLVRMTPGALSSAPGPAPAAVGAPAEGGAFEPAEIWRIVKRRKLMIALTFITLFALVVLATFLIGRYAPAYTSTAYVQLEAPLEKLGLATEQMAKDYVIQQLNTEAANLKSPETLLDLLKQEDIKATTFCKWYGEGDTAQMECLFELQDMLRIGAVKDTYLVQVSLAVRKADEATRIVNTLVQRYIERSRSSATDERRIRLNQLKQTQAESQQELENVRRRIGDLRAQRDMPALESERDVLRDVTSILNNTKAELLARKADIKAQLDTVQGVDPRNLPLSAEIKIMVESDPVLRTYQQQVEQLDVQINVLRQSQLGDEHREMLRMRMLRDEYSQKEAARREQLITDYRTRQVESLSQEQQRIENSLYEVGNQLAEHEAEQRDLDSAITLLENLQRDEQRYDQQLAQIALAVREAEHQHNIEAQQGRLVIAGLARDATAPSRPQPVLYLGGGFVLSLLLAVGLALLRDLTDQSLRTPIDVARHGHVSVLGCVPQLDDEEADLEEIELATRTAPQSLVAEAFRQIRAHLLFSGPRESQQMLLITSPRPEDGKTAMGINLAVTFAQGNERTLLIDCNFRRPGIRSAVAFPKAHSEGLSNVLVGHDTLERVIAKTDLPNLDVLTSGPMPPNPSELLGSPAMRALLQRTRELYDRVILDGPPCLLISDALVAAMQVDGVILVARAGRNTKGTLRRAREQLQRINARVIGAIFNGVQVRPGGYLRQQYREFYEYTSEEVVPRELAAGPAEIEPRAAEDDEPNHA